jgi:hypothetical protein
MERVHCSRHAASALVERWAVIPSMNIAEVAGTRFGPGTLQWSWREGLRSSKMQQRSATASRSRSSTRLRFPGHTAVKPNPSLNRRANGRPPGPAWRYAVHFRQSGPGVLPLSPG